MSSWHTPLQVYITSCRPPPANDLPANVFLSGSIYGFNVAANRSIQQLATKRGVPLRLSNIIYKLIDALKDELSSRLPPLVHRNTVGE